MVASKTDNPNKGFPGSSKGPDVTEKKSDEKMETLSTLVEPVYDGELGDNRVE